jgi:hypothetical protein
MFVERPYLTQTYPEEIKDERVLLQTWNVIHWLAHYLMCPYLVGIVFPAKSLTPHNMPALNSFMRMAMNILIEDKIHVGVSLALKTLKSIVSGVPGLVQLLV